MTTQEIQEQIIEDFSIFSDWLEKYDFLIEQSKSLPIIDPKYKTTNYIINGCQSRVWVNAELKDDGLIYFSADSDAIITKGIIALLIKVMDGRSPEEIINIDLFFIDAIGLKENLSPTRSNGLLSMIKQMKMYALAYKAKINSEQ